MNVKLTLEQYKKALKLTRLECPFSVYHGISLGMKTEVPYFMCGQYNSDDVQDCLRCHYDFFITEEHPALTKKPKPTQLTGYFLALYKERY